MCTTNDEKWAKIIAAFTTSTGKIASSKKMKPGDREALMELMPQFRSPRELLWSALNKNDRRPTCEVCGSGDVAYDGKSFKRTCSLKCAANHPDRSKKIKSTVQARYGVDHPSQRPEHLANLIKKYGKVPGAYGTDERKAIIKEKYGVENVFSSEVIKEKIKASMLDRYGVINPRHDRDINQRAMDTYSREHGGVGYSSAKVSEAASRTTLSRHGVTNAMKSEAIRARATASWKQKYGGVGYASPKVRELVKATSRQRYGVDHPNKSELIKSKIVESRRRRFVERVLPKKLESIRELLDTVPDNWTVDDYTGTETSYRWKHLKCGLTFSAALVNGSIPRCPRCFTAPRPHQILIDELVKRHPSLKMKVNCRSQITPYELDIFFPDHNVAVEVNGVWLYRADGPSALTLIEKTELAQQKNITLLHFWDFEVLEKLDVVCSMIAHRLKLSPVRVAARACEVVSISWTEAKEFLDQNHLSNGGLPGNYRLGLKHRGELLAVAVIGQERFVKHRSASELYRFATKAGVSVIGGLSKLINRVPGDLVTYADRRYSSRVGYTATGFEDSHVTVPGYFYWHKNHGAVSRYSVQGKGLIRLLGNKYDPSLSESENLEATGFIKLIDCGSYKLIKRGPWRTSSD